MKRVIPEVFLKSAEKCEDKVAFNYFDGGWKMVSYKELMHAVKSIASHLIKSGIQKGDRVAIVSENRPEWCMSYLGISLSGGVAVPVDAQLGQDEIKNLLADSETKVIFHSKKTEGHVREASGALYPPVALINLDSPDFKDVSKTPEPERYPELSEEDLASIIYTSGTTGKPKGVMLTHNNFCSDAEALVEARILSENDSVLGVLPLHHTYPFMGNLLIPAFLGIPVTYPQSLKGPDLMTAMREKGVTILVSVPQLLELIRNGIINKIKHLHGPLPGIMLGILKISGNLRENFKINLGKFFFRSVHKALGRNFRFFASGGAKLDPEIMKDLEALGLTVLEGYGLTETSPVVTFNPIEKRKPGSVGKPLPSAEIKIIDPEKHQEPGIMQEGEIVIRGPMVMKGYYKNPQATDQVLKGGWFYSGDLGYFDNDGYLFITGRLKEVIVLSSGKNIYPDDVEKQYLKIDFIKEICVIGFEEKGMVESIQAIIVPDLEYAKKSGTRNLQEALKWEINKVSSHLPQYMRIKGYVLYPEPLPRTPLGKLRRFMIKDLLKVKSEELKVKREEDRKLLEDEIGRKVVECIMPLLKQQVPVQSTDNLELDLGLDSLAKLELVVALEKTFSMKLPETFTSEIQTVEELVAKVKEFGKAGKSEVEAMPQWGDILKTEPELDEMEKIGLDQGPLDRMMVFLGLNLVKIILKIFFRLRAEGLHYLPEKGSYIITPNHTSYLDAFCVGGALPSKLFTDLYSLGVQEYFVGGFRGFFARVAHVIPIDTEAYLNKAMQLSSYVLRNGKSLLIFPEGGRSFDGELMEFKKGVGILSLELNVPVVPAYIEGAFEALPRGAKWPRVKQITVKFGKPLHPSDIDFTKKPSEMDVYQFFMNEVRERVKELRDQS
jgi:long-chain acyl-CoA synthetase